MKKLLIALISLTISFTACEKSDHGSLNTSNEKKGGIPGGPNGQGGNPNNPAVITYIPTYFNGIDVNLQWDTTACGILQLSWDEMHPNIESHYIRTLSAPTSCWPAQSDPNNPLRAYINYGWSCNFDPLKVYNDVQIGGNYQIQSNDTVYTFFYTSSPQTAVTGLGQWDCN